MPIDEIEYHPYLQVGEAIQSSRMIVGTFPIYSLTNPRTEQKNQLQDQRNDLSFFYGSRSNSLWNWYRRYVDTTVDIQNPVSIIKSLGTEKVAISDVISQCTRVNESFEDNSLRQIVWNLPLAGLIESQIEKILCTSKSAAGAMGWLRDKILLPSGFILQTNSSEQLHHQILATIPDSNTQIKLIAQVLQKESKQLSIVALPSPGSPERRLSDFGLRKNIHTTTVYLQQYLGTAFNWFLN